MSGRGETHSLCWWNGRIVPLCEAHLHPLDRGFVYGDGIYEVVKVLGGRPLLLAEHLDRLQRGLAEVEIPVSADLESMAQDLLKASALGNGSLYIQVSRGAGPRAHIPPLDLEPTLLAIPMAHSHSGPEALAQGLSAVTVRDLRWGRCDLKSTSLMGTVLGKLRARHEGAAEVIFAAPDGRLREGGSTSFFAVRDGVLETHPLGRRILPSITRGVILTLARNLGWQVRQAAPRLAERQSWQEAFLCGTLTAVRGLTRLDGAEVGAGEVGPVTRCLIDAYARFEREAALV